jgi:hypothetical protein
MIEHKATFTWGATGHAEQTSTFTGVPNGLTHTFVVVAGATDNNVTFTLTLRNSHGVSLFSKASIADDGTTVLGPSTTENHEWPFIEGGSIGIDPSGDAGASGAQVTVYVYAVKK